MVNILNNTNSISEWNTSERVLKNGMEFLRHKNEVLKRHQKIWTEVKKVWGFHSDISIKAAKEMKSFANQSKYDVLLFKMDAKQHLKEAVEHDDSPEKIEQLTAIVEAAKLGLKCFEKVSECSYYPTTLGKNISKIALVSGLLLPAIAIFSADRNLSGEGIYGRSLDEVNMVCSNVAVACFSTVCCYLIELSRNDEMHQNMKHSQNIFASSLA